ncbi:MAG: carboxymuconolactone decarboxylase family protein [Alphaproteobacteria bacterium]|nr:carboxymuconolactone decarboxylase family protein [Alphaproteobacteria bacterium]
MMMDKKTTGSAHIEPLGLDELAEVEDIIAIARQASGYIPTSMRIMAHKPDILRAFGGLIGAIMRTETELPMATKWLTAHAVSTSAGCVYCQAHTAANGGKKGLSADKVQDLLNYRASPLFDDSERGVIEFGLAAGEVPNATNRSHFDALREHFTQGQIVEIVSVISLFGWLNRWNDTFASDLEDAPRAFATEKLADRGWEVGKHAAE